MAFSRTREFFQDGGVLVSGGTGRLAKSLAAIGVAACVAIVPTALEEAGNFYQEKAESPYLEGAANLYQDVATTHETERSSINTGGDSYLGQAFAEKAISFAEKAGSLLAWHAGRVASNFHTHKYGDYEVPQFVAHEIVRAAKDTGFPADMLMAIVEKESSFVVDARPQKGTALGLMQFIEQTWLEVVMVYGHEFGLAEEAASIDSRPSKRGGNVLFVADPAEQKRILDLRTDPYLSAAFAAKNLIAAKERIEARLKSPMPKDDLYLPHFLGTSGAGSLLAKSKEKPNAQARKVFPKAARYNAGMFRGKGGKALTVRQLHERARSTITTRVGKYKNVKAEVESVTASYAGERPEDIFAVRVLDAAMFTR